MSLLTGGGNLLSSFTGGNSTRANSALKEAQAYLSGVQTPTAQQLTLPQLQQYVEAGIMTPEQAQSYLQQNNALANENVDQTGTAAQIAALNQLSGVANAGAEGTPMEQAQMEQALQQMRTADQGSIGAIEQGMAARGTPQALIQAALASQVQGQNAQQAHADAVNAQGAMYQNALNALSQQGNLGGALQGQQNTQANTVANAANAMQQFNAQNQQQNAQFNANNRQEANTMNAANRQQIANNNTGLVNARTQYNANVPQQVFNNQLSKAQAQAGVSGNQSNLYQNQGQQNAGIISGLINTATSFIPKPPGASSMGGMPTFTPSNPTEAGFNAQYKTGGMAHGGYVDHDHSVCMAHGGYCMAEGGTVPGQAPFSGDTEMNDMVPITASSGEAVIPRSSVAQHPDMVASLLGDQNNSMATDVQDVATLLKAMRAIRTGAA